MADDRTDPSDEIADEVLEDEAPDDDTGNDAPASTDGAFTIPGLDDVVEDLDDDEDEPGVHSTTSTSQYEGLAEAVREADEAGPVAQNVSVHVAGLGAGIASFDDLESGSGVATATDDRPDETTERILEELEAEEADRAELRLRVLTAVGLVAALAIAAWAGAVWFTALVGLIAFLGMGEYYAAARRAGYAPVAAVGLLAIVGAFVAGYRGGAYGIGVVTVVAVLALLLLYAVTPRRDPLENAAVTTLGFAWVSLLAFVGPMTRADGWWQLLALIVLTVGALDVGSYFVGRSLGRTSLAPTLSPGKTIEGLAGGVIAAFAVALGASQVPWMSDVVTIPIALGVAAATSALGPLGDLGESAIKRSVGIKDMGTILPGHGGILDRIDSFLIALPGIYAVLIWLDAIP